MDRAEFRDFVGRGAAGVKPAAVLHQGACADTTEQDGRYMLDNNFTYSKELLHWALDRRVPLVYASSASVYGSSRHCAETPDHEGPLNVYAYSKLLFDNYVRRLIPQISTTVVGLRYFNVYGPREAHKGRMASMVWQLYRQLKTTGVAQVVRGDRWFRRWRAEARLRLRWRRRRGQPVLRHGPAQARGFQCRHGNEPQLQRHRPHPDRAAGPG